MRRVRVAWTTLLFAVAAGSLNAPGQDSPQPSGDGDVPLGDSAERSPSRGVAEPGPEPEIVLAHDDRATSSRAPASPPVAEPPNDRAIATVATAATTTMAARAPASDQGSAGEEIVAATSTQQALAFLAQLDASAFAEPTASASSAQRDEPIYADVYLFADDALPPLEAARSYASQPFGQETLAVDLSSFTSRDDFLGDDTERGARVFWSRETENWGTFDLDVQLADVNSTFAGRPTDGSEAVATLRQSSMPVSATALLSTAAGHQRTPFSALLHGGYRYRLPSSIVLGINTELAAIDRRMRLTLGNIGAYRGVRMPRFDDTGGRVSGFAYEQAVNDAFDLGAEVANVRGDNDVRDHTSLLLAGRYTPAGDVHEHALRILADDGGQFGFWADSRMSRERWPTLHYGVSYLEPELTWTDQPIPHDQMSAYLRAESGKSFFDVAAGYDFLETGVKSDLLVPTTTHSAFVTGQLRIRRALSIGASATFSQRSIETLVDEVQDISRLNMFASLRSRIGTTRLEAFSYALDSPIQTNHRARDGIAASISWRMPERLRLTTELRVEDELSEHGDTKRTELSVLFRYNLFDDLSLGLNSAVYSTRGIAYAEDDGLSLSADAQWTINRNWRATLSVNRNKADYDITGSNPFDISDEAGTTSIWLTLNYQRRSGQAYPQFGRTQDGMSGTGSISGEVYYDENRDSLRQPSERAPEGIVVILDGQYETRTDAQGRYTFSPVPTGAHELMILTDALPLPWALDNEAPRRAVVRYRQDAPVDFPLVAIQ